MQTACQWFSPVEHGGLDRLLLCLAAVSPTPQPTPPEADCHEPMQAGESAAAANSAAPMALIPADAAAKAALPIEAAVAVPEQALEPQTSMPKQAPEQKRVDVIPINVLLPSVIHTGLNVAPGESPKFASCFGCLLPCVSFLLHP